MTNEIIVCRAGFCNDDDEDPKCCAVCDTRKKCDDPCNHAEEGICNHQIVTDRHSFQPDHTKLAEENNRAIGTVCHNCGGPVDEDNIYHDEDNNILCESCYDEFYDTCHHCEDSYLKDDMHVFDGEYYCQSCYDEYFTECEYCGGTISVDDSHTLKTEGGSEKTCCESCWDQRGNKCDHCEEYYESGVLRTTEEDNSYCNGCFDDHAGECSNCGEMHDSTELENIDGDKYCRDCAEEHRANHPTEESEEPSS